MALQYGYNITASDMRKLLEKNDKLQSGVRTWRQLFGNASLGYGAQSGAITADYSDVIAQAYKSNQAQNNAIMSAGLSAGATRDLISANRSNLHAAYDTYVKNYRENIETAASAYNAEADAINNALTERATNFAKLYNSAYQYLTEELSGLTNMNNEQYLTVQGLDWLIDKDTAMVRPWESLSTELFNPDASLSEKGQEFFDAMFNARPDEYIWADENVSRNAKSFDQWLSDKSIGDKSYEGLREWWAGQDAFNYTFGGTNAGTAKQMIGLESTDDTYAAREHTMLGAFKQFNAFETPTLNTQVLNDLTTKARDARARTKPYTGTNMMDAYRYTNSLTGKEVPGWQATRLEAEAQKSWAEYLTAMNKQNEELTSSFKTSIGSAEYETFLAENKNLMDEYNEALARVNKSQYYSAVLLQELRTKYTEVIARMKKFLAAKSTSGF